MRTMTFAFTALLFAAPLFAQADHPHRTARTILTDDDDGKVEVYRRGDASATPDGAAIEPPVMEILFVGSRWDAASEHDLIDGVRAIRTSSIAGTREVPGRESLNDLQVQQILERGMSDGSLPLRDDAVIYVVFLSRGVQSTLGASRGTVDYDSYHSHFRAHDTTVRYVVVPWNDDRAAMRDAAAQSALRASGAQ